MNNQPTETVQGENEREYIKLEIDGDAMFEVFHGDAKRYASGLLSAAETSRASSDVQGFLANLNVALCCIDIVPLAPLPKRPNAKLCLDRAEEMAARERHLCGLAKTLSQTLSDVAGKLQAQAQRLDNAENIAETAASERIPLSMALTDFCNENEIDADDPAERDRWAVPHSSEMKRAAQRLSLENK